MVGIPVVPELNRIHSSGWSKGPLQNGMPFLISSLDKAELVTSLHNSQSVFQPSRGMFESCGEAEGTTTTLSGEIDKDASPSRTVLSLGI